jgi:hypothetical protein
VAQPQDGPGRAARAGAVPLSEFSLQSRHKLLTSARAVPIIAILLAGRRTTSGSMHPTDATVTNRRRTTPIPCSFRFGYTPRRFVGALHGVDGHFTWPKGHLCNPISPKSVVYAAREAQRLGIR